MLFKIGNRPEPPSAWPGLEEFLSFLARKEFRAAIALTNVKLLIDSYGMPAKITYDELFDCGYTPIRPFYSKGEHDFSRGQWWKFRLLPAGSGVVGSGALSVRVGQPWRKAGEMITGYDAPFVTIRLSYRLLANGSGELRCESTDIPSQKFYRDWGGTGAHDMLSLTETDIDRFFGGGEYPPESVKWAESF